jgi:ribosomal protein S18 acetylase RimI-like enzyme
VVESFRLVRDLTEPVGEVRWPPLVRLVPFTAALAPQAHALLALAYRSGGGAVASGFETWWAATRRDPEFDAELCFCASSQGQLVGFALCWTAFFVKDLVVHPEFRRHGIGEALLTAALHAFRLRGAAEAALKVHAENDTARRLYQRLGFSRLTEGNGV